MAGFFLNISFGSVPFHNLFRLLIWQSQIIIAAIILKILIVSVSLGLSSIAKIKFTKKGKQLTAVITLTDTYLVMVSTMQNIAKQIRKQ
jgi:hypothetical protein